MTGVSTYSPRTSTAYIVSPENTDTKQREVLTAVQELSKQTVTRILRMRRVKCTSAAFKDAKENDYRQELENTTRALYKLAGMKPNEIGCNPLPPGLSFSGF